MLKPRARRLLLLALLGSLASGCSMWKEQKVSSWSSATGGEQLERLLWQEIKAKNWSELEKHLAPTFVSLTPSGTRDRAASLENLKALQLSDYTLGDFSTQPSGNDLVVSYTMMRRGSYDGQPLPSGAVRMMTVWQQMKRGWVAILHAEVP